MPPGEQLELSEQPDAALFQRWQAARDRAARDVLIARYMPLARRLASRYRSAHEPLEDLVQVASIGLIGAIERFDRDRGVAFSSFAVPTILGEIKRHFRSTAWSAHVPRRAQELALQVERASDALTSRDGRSCSVEELARYLEIDVDDVLCGLEAAAAHHAASLDAPTRSDPGEESLSLADRIGGEDLRLEHVDTNVALSAGVAQLPRLEREVLALRLNAGLKQIEIAERLGCSQMQVSRMLRRATARLRELDAIG